MEKHVCVVVLHDSTLTSAPPVHRRSRIRVCLLFVMVMSITCVIIVAWSLSSDRPERQFLCYFRSVHTATVLQ